MGYYELAGFLFSVACSAELVVPSEWVPRVLGEMESESPKEAQRVIELMLALYNHINREVLERKPAIPSGIKVHPEAIENFGPETPLGLWAAGYGAGQLWLEETWEGCMRRR